MFKSEKEKRQAEIGMKNALLSSKSYSSKELENFKKIMMTPCSYCAGKGIDPYDEFTDCSTCKGYGALVPDLDPRRVLSTIATLTSEYSHLKSESNQIKKVLEIMNEELNEE